MGDGRGRATVSPPSRGQGMVCAGVPALSSTTHCLWVKVCDSALASVSDWNEAVTECVMSLSVSEQDLSVGRTGLVSPPIAIGCCFPLAD